MSSFLCFVCHSTVNADTNEDTREKYREVIGMNLCPDSHLCYICCYFLSKMCLFKSICLKRSLEYPVLFSEKGTINLHRSETSISILCPEDICLQHLNTSYHYYNNSENSQSDFDDHNYCELQDDRNFDINDTPLKTVRIENLFNEKLLLPNLEPVRIIQNDLINGEWTQNVPKNNNTKNSSLIELNNYKNDINIDRLVIPIENNESISIDNEKIIPIVMGLDVKDVPIECTNSQNLQEVITDINYPDTDYEQVENCENENIENNLFENDQSHNIDVENNLNDNNTNINENEKNINDITTNINENIINTNYSTTNINDDVINIDENESNINENVTNTQEPEININEPETIINETFININEPVIDINETLTNNELSEEERSSETDNPSDTDDNNYRSTEKKTKPKKRKKKELYEKIILTIEEQKIELEKARKEDKYIAASYKCHSCAMYFHFKDTYQTHMMRHEESNGEHFCTICSLRFANPAVLRSHVANHSVRYKCRHCSDTVRARQRPTHARHCTGKRDSVSCRLCGRVFQSVQHFQQHLRRYHGTKVRRYLCNVCGRSYDTRPRLRTHIITHVNSKFDCDQCSSTFSSPYTLNQHKKSKHLPREPEVHNCSSCKLTYSSRKNLLAHLRNALAHKESVYKCVACERTCPSLTALEAHTAAVHTRSRHLACRLCQKRYSTTRSLVRHMASHKEGRPIPLCHSCGATFKSITVLKKHLKNVCEKDTRKCQIIDEELLQVPYFE